MGQCFQKSKQNQPSITDSGSNTFATSGENNQQGITSSLRNSNLENSYSKRRNASFKPPSNINVVPQVDISGLSEHEGPPPRRIVEAGI
eukprot:gene10697-2796_t